MARRKSLPSWWSARRRLFTANLSQCRDAVEVRSALLKRPPVPLICARTSELGGYQPEKASIANRRMSGFPLNMSHRGIHRFKQFLSGVEWCAQLLNESALQHIGPNCLKHVCRIHAQLSFGMSAFAFRFGKEAPLRPLNAMARSDTSALIPCFSSRNSGCWSIFC